MHTGNAVHWFADRHVQEGYGECRAFQDPWRTLSYQDLQAATCRFAGALRGAGIGRERRVVLLLQDTIDFPIAFWGTMRSGAVPVPINTLLTADTVGYILRDCRAEAVVISAPLVPALQPVLQGIGTVIVSQPDGSEPASADPAWLSFPGFLGSGDPQAATAQASPDEVAFWLYSSGSTGPRRA